MTVDPTKRHRNFTRTHVRERPGTRGARAPARASPVATVLRAVLSCRRKWGHRSRSFCWLLCMIGPQCATRRLRSINGSTLEMAASPGSPQLETSRDLLPDVAEIRRVAVSSTRRKGEVRRGAKRRSNVANCSEFERNLFERADNTTIFVNFDKTF